jgi:hypothetical protein
MAKRAGGQSGFCIVGQAPFARCTEKHLLGNLLLQFVLGVRWG